MPPPTGSTGCWRAPSATCRGAACRRSCATGGSRSPARWSASSRPRVQPGAEIVLEIPAAAPAEPRGEPIALDVVYEDDDIIVIDKPAGLVVHPAAGHWTRHAGQRADRPLRRQPLRHRRRQAAGHRAPARQGHQRAHGRRQDRPRPSRPRGAVRRPWPHRRARARLSRAGLGRARPDRAAPSTARSAAAPRNREKMAVVADDAAATPVTHYAVRGGFGPAREPVASCLRCRLETGRTHQIRVHMAHIGHPLLGDAIYGAGFKTKAVRLSPEAREALRGLGRQALHAAVLGFEHPSSGENLHFESRTAARHAAADRRLAAGAALSDTRRSRHRLTAMHNQSGRPALTLTVPPRRLYSAKLEPHIWAASAAGQEGVARGSPLGRGPKEENRWHRQRCRCSPTKGACPAISTRSASSRCWSRARSTCSPSAGASMTTRDAAHKLVTSHLRLVAKIAMGYRGYGLPIGEVISEGNVGLMQAVKRFEPDRGFRLATYAMWWIRASIQEYILRSWSLVKMGTTAAQKKLFFNLRRLKSQISGARGGRSAAPTRSSRSPPTLGVTEQDVIDMNRRLGGDASLNAPLREEGEGEWQDWLVDDSASQETIARRRAGGAQNRLAALRDALSVAQRARAAHLRGAPARRGPDHAGGAVDRVRRQPRARPPDRGARLREAAEGGQEEPRRPRGAARRRGRGLAPLRCAAVPLLLPPLAEGLVDELLARDPLLEGQDGALPG